MRVQFSEIESHLNSFRWKHFWKMILLTCQVLSYINEVIKTFCFGRKIKINSVLISCFYFNCWNCHVKSLILYANVIYFNNRLYMHCRVSTKSWRTEIIYYISCETAFRRYFANINFHESNRWKINAFKWLRQNVYFHWTIQVRLKIFCAK